MVTEAATAAAGVGMVASMAAARTSAAMPMTVVGFAVMMMVTAIATVTVMTTATATVTAKVTAKGAVAGR